MSDNTNIRQPEDPTKVNINQQWEIDYWCKKWSITKERLLKIVKKVGPMVVDIKKELAR